MPPLGVRRHASSRLHRTSSGSLQNVLSTVIATLLRCFRALCRICVCSFGRNGQRYVAVSLSISEELTHNGQWNTGT